MRIIAGTFTILQKASTKVRVISDEITSQRNLFSISLTLIFGLNSLPIIVSLAINQIPDIKIGAIARRIR
jgi:hypothetical protein